MCCVHDAEDLETLTMGEEEMQIFQVEDPAPTSSQDLSSNPEEPEECEDMGAEPEPIMTFDMAVKQTKALTRFLFKVFKPS